MSDSATQRRGLTRDRVLAAAATIADDEGLDAVTMRRVAGSLGVEAMSLYHHVDGKDGLLDGLAEHVVEQVVEAVAAGTEPDDDWRSAVRRRCLVAREVMLRHPWAPGLLATRGAVPTAALAHYEAILAAMVRGGLSYHLAHRGLHALGSLALGFVQEVFSPGGPDGDADDVTEEQLAAMADAFPHLTAMVAAEVHAHDDPVLGWCDSSVEFAFTLDLLLDGLARAAAPEPTDGTDGPESADGTDGPT